MRNIKEHPITQNEVVETLDRLIADELNKEQIGSLTPMILAGFRHVVKDHWELVEKNVSWNASWY